MSKGLTRQQLRLLGLAVAVSRLRHGQPKSHVPLIDPEYRLVAQQLRLRCGFPVVHHMPPDLTIELAVHIVGGVGLIPHKPPTPRLSHSGWRLIHMQLETTPAALSARSAISREVS